MIKTWDRERYFLKGFNMALFHKFICDDNTEKKNLTPGRSKMHDVSFFFSPLTHNTQWRDLCHRVCWQNHGTLFIDSGLVSLCVLVSRRRIWKSDPLLNSANTGCNIMNKRGSVTHSCKHRSFDLSQAKTYIFIWISNNLIERKKEIRKVDVGWPWGPWMDEVCSSSVPEGDWDWRSGCHWDCRRRGRRGLV